MAASCPACTGYPNPVCVESDYLVGSSSKHTNPRPYIPNRKPLQGSQNLSSATRSLRPQAAGGGLATFGCHRLRREPLSETRRKHGLCGLLHSRGTILQYIILYYSLLFYIIVYTILYYIILYFSTLYYIIPYYTKLFYIILYYTILQYIILYYTITNIRGDGSVRQGSGKAEKPVAPPWRGWGLP